MTKATAIPKRCSRCWNASTSSETCSFVAINVTTTRKFDLNEFTGPFRWLQISLGFEDRGGWISERMTWQAHGSKYTKKLSGETDDEWLACMSFDGWAGARTKVSEDEMAVVTAIAKRSKFSVRKCSCEFLFDWYLSVWKLQGKNVIRYIYYLLEKSSCQIRYIFNQ